MAKKKKTTLHIKGVDIRLLSNKQEDFFSITDIAKKFNPTNPSVLIINWLRNKDTIEFLGVWEQLHNPKFNLIEFDKIKNEAGFNRFVLSAKKWINETGAIGIRSKAGRYGGTYAHKDIALGFCYWISPPFQLYLLKEFQRLKAKEAEEEQASLKWQLKRTLAKVNYRIHTDAVQQHLIPSKLTAKQQGIVYASEADLLNVALFGQTAKQWRTANSNKKGNIRDHATGEQLLVLSNLENLNAEFIKDGLDQEERLERLNEIAIYQMQVLVVPTTIRQLPKGI